MIQKKSKITSFKGEHDITQKTKLACLAEKFVHGGVLSSQTVVLLEGPLGSGKSEWVRLCLKSLGYKHSAVSPSFSLLVFYEIGEKNIYHIDLYRVKSEEDLEAIDFFDLFRKPGLIFIEWADRLNDELLPADWLKVRLRFSWKNKKRTLAIN